MSDIFIAYAREDRDRVALLAQALEASGWSVWWDREIPIDSEFSKVIERELTAARCIIVVWSTHSISSSWVIEEAYYGLERGVLIPVLIDRVAPPLPFRRIQAADLIDWSGSSTSPEFSILVSGVAGILGTTPTIFREAISTAPEKAPPKFYSCFISYSSRDEAFARKIYSDLRNNGVQCWYAPEDMKIGSKIADTIGEEIQRRDRMLLILSENSVNSSWVSVEVNKAFSEERKRNKVILFPIRLDDSVMEATTTWAKELREERHIGDFRDWKNRNSYQLGLNRLLNDLAQTPTGVFQAISQSDDKDVNAHSEAFYVIRVGKKEIMTSMLSFATAFLAFVVWYNVTH